VKVTLAVVSEAATEIAGPAVSSGGTVTGVSVASDTATVTVTFPTNGSTTAKTYTVSIASGSAVIKGSGTVAINQAAAASGTRKELTAGLPVYVAASAMTADVSFTGALGLSLSTADFAVDNGAYVTNVQVASETTTVSVSFAANTEATLKTYIVSIASGSAVIKGGATVVITQAAVSASDTRIELITGSAVNVAASATTADVSFTGAWSLSLSATDFTVSSGGTISDVQVASDTATVIVTFPANGSTTAKTYTVSIASGSAIIKGSGTVASPAHGA
jgi:hypothetical protein